MKKAIVALARRLAVIMHRLQHWSVQPCWRDVLIPEFLATPI
jgi:hypothetical protein